MSKTRTGFRRAHCLAPVVGGGGYLLTGLFSVNRSFQTILRPPSCLEIGHKNRRGRRGASLKVRSDSIEAREHTHFEPKIKRLVSAPSPFRLEARPEREAAI